MSIGVRIGPAIGSRIGPAIGVGVDPIRASSASLTGVTKDAASGIYTPANATEWATVMTAAGIATGGPSSLYLCQEASGALADSIGSLPLPSEGVRQTYQNTQSGWTRKALSTTGDGWITTAAGAPDPSTTSEFMIAYAISATQAVDQSLLFLASVPASPRLRMDAAGPNLAVFNGVTSVLGSANPYNAVRPFGHMLNRARSVMNGYSDQEVISAALGTPSSKTVYLAGSGNVSFLYAALFSGTAAELTDAQVRTLYQTLGWAVAW